MGLFEHWPYTNFHELNLNWIIKEVKKLSEAWKNIDDIIDEKIQDIDADVYAILASRPVNVLTLGVKNDGSADCSDIINQATSLYELYFPAGIYRVDHPLKLKHSIYGCGNDSDFVRLGIPLNGSTLKSNISGSSVDGVIEISEQHCNVKGFNIQCNTNESGLIINTTVNNERCRISDLTIYNLGNSYGIDCNPAGSSSRILDAENINIFGRGMLSNSTGIRIGQYAYDSILDNVCMNAVQKGLINYSFVKLLNCHIWTGALVNENNPTWWDDTMAIVAHEMLQGDNIYTDTAHVHVYIATDQQIQLSNVVCWSTDSQTGGSTADQVCFYVDNAYTDQALLSVDGLIIRDDGKMSGITGNLSGRIGSSFSNVHLISNKDNSPDDNVTGIVGRLYTEDTFKQHVENGKYYEVASIDSRYGGTAVIEIMHGNSICKVEYINNATPKLVKAAESGTSLGVYYKDMTDSSGRSFVRVYALAGSAGVSMTARRISSGGATMTSYNTSRKDGTRLTPEVLSIGTGLTEVTA